MALVAATLVVQPALGDGQPLVIEEERVVITIIKPPTPTYPLFASLLGFVGRCDVLFDVEVADQIIVRNIKCNNEIFCHSARAAVEQAEVTVRNRNGLPDRRENIMWPVEYTFEDIDKDVDLPLRACERAVEIS